MRWRLPDDWRRRTDWLPTDTTAGQVLRGLRWAAVAAYAAAVLAYAATIGIPLDREGLLLWIAIGLGCACIGRHPVWLAWVAIDFVPLALVLVVYDWLRGLSDTVGMPTWWHPQIDVDRFLFFGHEPTLWLQEHLKHPRSDLQWYDVVVCLCYFSFFFLPYVTAGVLWLRRRSDFYRWSLRFVALSFLGFALFLLIPAAPPWAAAQCRAADVANHPNNPRCMSLGARPVTGNLLGTYTPHVSGANSYLERIAGNSFFEFHLNVAHGLWSKGFNAADAVAAVPSLHVGGTLLFCLFMWSRVGRWWKPVLIAYPFVMMFSLTYAGEHYVADGIAGALAAWSVHQVATRMERRRAGRRKPGPGPDTLESPPDPPDDPQETQCPPSHPQPATTPSST